MFRMCDTCELYLSWGERALLSECTDLDTFCDGCSRCYNLNLPANEQPKTEDTLRPKIVNPEE